MQCSTSLHRSACRPFRNAAGQPRMGVVKSVRPVLCLATAQRQQDALADTSSGLDMLTLSVAAMMVQPLAAYADEAEVVTSAADTVTTAAEKAAAAVPAAAEKAAEAAANTVEAPAWLGYVLLLSPIILYALFNVYRNQVNPRAKFTDFLFVCAGVAVIANLVSILAFKIRLF